MKQLEEMSPEELEAYWESRGSDSTEPKRLLQNRISTPAPSPTKYRGVSWAATRRRWVAKLHVEDIQIFVADFGPDHQVKAAKAYDSARYWTQDFSKKFPKLNDYEIVPEFTARTAAIRYRLLTFHKLIPQYTHNLQPVMGHGFHFRAPKPGYGVVINPITVGGEVRPPQFEVRKEGLLAFQSHGIEWVTVTSEGIIPVPSDEVGRIGRNYKVYPIAFLLRKLTRKGNFSLLQ